jgi:hypothetical protein
MQWYYFWLLLIGNVGVIVWTVIVYQRTTFADGVTASHPCDRAALCAPSNRGNYDTSWLCCEATNGYAVSSILSANIAYVLSDDFWFSIGFEFLFQALAAALFMFFGSVPLESVGTGFSTISGTLVGTVLITEFIGILLGVLLNDLSGWRGFRRPVRTTWVRLKYISISLFLFFLWFLPGLATASGFNYGEVIAFVVEAAVVGFALPYIIVNSDMSGIECPSRPGDEYARLRWWWFAEVLFVGLSGTGIRFFFNEFYEAWLFAYIYILVLLVAMVVYHRLARSARMARWKKRAALVIYGDLGAES